MCWGKVPSVVQAGFPLVVSMGDIFGGSCHRYNFCRDRHVFVATKHVLWRQKCVCRDKSFVAKKEEVCRDKILKKQKQKTKNICHDKYLSRQNYVCMLLYKTRLLWRQKYACLDKSFVATNTCFILVAPADDRERNVPSDFKCVGGKFLQSSKRASIPW